MPTPFLWLLFSHMVDLEFIFRGSQRGPCGVHDVQTLSLLLGPYRRTRVPHVFEPHVGFLAVGAGRGTT